MRRLEAIGERPVPDEHRTGRSEPVFGDVRSDPDAMVLRAHQSGKLEVPQSQGDQTSYSRTLNAEK